MDEAAAQLIIHLPAGGDQEVDLRRGSTELGRGPAAGIRVAVPEVSGRHAELHWDGSQLWMRDLSSTNGTEVNGRHISSWTTLRDGDRVRWGPVDADVVLPRSGGAADGSARGTTVMPVVVPDVRATAARPSARRIFLSHASEDKRLARSIAATLRRQGWEPWLDESGIPGGSPWAASIQQALRSSSVVVLLITANSVSKEWVLDEITAARNLRVPIIPAVLEHVRMPDGLQLVLQRTQQVDVSALTTFSSEDQSDRTAAYQRLDGAILDVLERQGRTNPDRVRMRIGRVLEAIGAVLVLGGFGSFLYAGFRATQHAAESFPVGVLVAFAVFIGGGIIGATGGAMVRAGRAKGL
jgi:pSer/pThr/pTyr-binding forkhead associated (FHA) protein